jgi:hypothetical protein
MMARREFLEGVAALAGTRWEEEDYDIDDADNWDAMAGGIYETGSVSPALITGSVERPMSAIRVAEDDVDEHHIDVDYTSKGVHCAVEAENADGDVRIGAMCKLTPEQAKELGAILYQAGEELRLYREQGSGEESHE